MVQEIGLDQLIREHPFFEGFDDAALELIAGCAANERFDAGQYVFREGPAWPTSSIWFVTGPWRSRFGRRGEIPSCSRPATTVT